MKTVLAFSAAAAAFLATSSLAQECTNGYWETGNGVIFTCEEGMETASAQKDGDGAILEETAQFAGETVETVGEAAGTIVEESVDTADAIVEETLDTADIVVEESVETADAIVPEEEFLAAGETAVETVEEPLVTGSIETGLEDEARPEQFPLNFSNGPECVNGYWETGNGVIMVCEPEIAPLAQGPASSTPIEPAADMNATVEEEPATSEGTGGGSTY